MMAIGTFEAIVKPLMKITVTEWALHEWHEVIREDDTVMYMRGRLRRPAAAAKAASDFKQWIKMVKALGKNC